MSILSVVHASGWEYTGGFFTDRVQFNCGSCSKLNRKNDLFPVHPRSFTATVSGSQCRWCGIINIFRISRTRYLGPV